MKIIHVSYESLKKLKTHKSSLTFKRDNKLNKKTKLSLKKARKNIVAKKYHSHKKVKRELGL